MKNRSSLIILLVILSLVGYIISSLYTFYMGFKILENGKLPNNYSDLLNPAISYLTSGLTGLVGGIVATGFGVEQNSPTVSKLTDSKLKLMNLGSYVSKSSNENNRERYGYIYSLTYIIIGVASIVVWVILNKAAIDSISNMATTFFGMVIPIVASYFSSNKPS